MKLFAIKHIKENALLGFSCTSNGDAEFCGDSSWSLGLYNDNVWTASSREIAEYAMATDTPWYNSTYERPQNLYKPKDLEIVEFEMVPPINTSKPKG